MSFTKIKLTCIQRPSLSQLLFSVLVPVTVIVHYSMLCIGSPFMSTVLASHAVSLMLQYNDGYPLGPVSNIFLTSFCSDLFTLQFFTMPVFVCCRWCKSVSCSHRNIYITTSTCYFHNSFVSMCLCACQCFVFNCIQVKRSDIYIYIYEGFVGRRIKTTKSW